MEVSLIGVEAVACSREQVKRIGGTEREPTRVFGRAPVGTVCSEVGNSRPGPEERGSGIVPDVVAVERDVEVNDGVDVVETFVL